MTLTIYSDDFDDLLNVANGGFSKKIFVESKTSGNEFNDIFSAMRHIVGNNIEIDEIVYNYSIDGDQMFKRWKLNG